MGRNRQIVDKVVAEITADSAKLGYKNADGSWKPYEEIWALGTTVNQIEPDPSRKTARDVLAMVGPDQAAAIMDAFEQESNTNSGLRLAFGAFTDYGEHGGLDFTNPQLIASLSALKVKGTFTEQTEALLKALGTKTASRFSQVGIPEDRQAHVRMAGEEVGQYPSTAAESPPEDPAEAATWTPTVKGVA